jgi:hypothetical protein
MYYDLFWKIFETCEKLHNLSHCFLFFQYYFCVSIIKSMKKGTTIDSHIKLLKEIIIIVVGILTIIIISISIGVSFGRNSVNAEKNQAVIQVKP